MTIAAPMLPVPSDFEVSLFTGWFFTAWAAGLTAVLLPWTLHRWRTRHDPVPLLMFLGGLMASFAEPMLDHLGHLWWANNLPGPALHAFSVRVPALIPPCYAITIGLESYWVANRFRRGLTARDITVLWLLICASDMLLEYPGVLLNAYSYYGHQPWEIARFPWYWAWSNGTTEFTIGFILSRIEPRLSGPDRGWIVLMVPAVFVAVESVTGAPSFLALNADLPTVLAWTLSAGTLALSLCTVRAVQLVAVSIPQPAGTVRRSV